MLVIQFSRIGRHNNVAIPVKSDDFEVIAKKLEKEAKKYLISSDVELIYNSQTKKGNLIAGFQNVGEFEIIQKEIPKKPKMKKYTIQPSQEIGDSGWISPEGKYYACNSYGHIDLADELVKSGLTKKPLQLGLDSDLEGWLHLSDGAFLFNVYEKLSQNQIDFMFSFLQMHQRTYIRVNGIHYDSLAEFLERHNQDIQ